MHPYRTAIPQADLDIVHWSEFDRGGHFAAMREPNLLAADLRAFSRKLREVKRGPNSELSEGGRDGQTGR
jgi:hypothetical protein